MVIIGIISAWLMKVEKSKLRDAFRLGLQTALSAAITYIVLRYSQSPEVFVGVLSAVLVVEPSIGNTFSSAKGRVLATLVGSVIGFVLLVIIPWGLGTALSLAIAMFVMNGISSIKPSWRYGVVAAVALAMGSEENAWETAIYRIIAIGVGVIIGIIISFIIWPEKSETRTDKYMSKALQALQKRLENAIKKTRSEDSSEEDLGTAFHSNLHKAKSTAKSIAFNDKHTYLKQIDAIERLYNSILIVNRVGLNSKTDVIDGNSGIEKDTENLKTCVLELTKQLTKEKSINEDHLSDLSNQIKKIKGNLKSSEDNRDLNLLRHTFVFGMTEIEKNINKLSRSIS